MAPGGEDPGADDERDPELRFDVVYSSLAPRHAEDIVWELKAHGFRARLRVVHRRTPAGRRTRLHQVLVPRGDASRAAQAIGLAQQDAALDDPKPFILRERVGEHAYQGLMTVVGIAIAFAIIGVFLIFAT